MNGNMFSNCQKKLPTYYISEEEDENYDTYEIHITNECGPTGPPGILGPVDESIVPDIAFTYDIGSVTYPYRQIHCNDIIFSDVDGSSQEIVFRENSLRLPAGTTIGGVHPGTIFLKGSLANVTLLPTTASLGDAFVIGTSLHVCINDIPVQYTVIDNIIGPEGPVGAPGPMGATGPVGPTGPALFQTHQNYISYDGMVKVQNLDVSGIVFNSLPLGILGHVSFTPINVANLVALWPSNNQSYLIAPLQFSVKGLSGTRKIRSHICVNINYSATNELYIALYDQNLNICKAKKKLNGNGSDIINIYHYSDLDVGLNKTYTVFLAAMNSGISINSYGSSYVVIEDIGS